MRILFDSNIMALAFLENISMHRTGIFRYADNMTRALNGLDEVELTFYSSLDKREKLLWEKKVLEIEHLKKTSLFNYSHPIKEKLAHLNQEILKSTSLYKVFLKSYRESLRVFMKTSNFFGKDVVKGLENFDIFFSPYHPIPKRVQEFKNINCFTAVHDLIPLKFPKLFKINKKPFFDQIFKRAYSNHYFLALSESTKADICHYYSINPDKIFVVHSAAQEDLFNPILDENKIKPVLEKYQINSPYILSLATLEPRKNIPFLIDAFKKLLQENPGMDLKLVLTGAKAWGSDEIVHRIRPFEEHILITGFIDDKDLASLYSGALAFVYPSLYEGFGLPPLESMRCNTPVIVSDRSSLPEVVGDAGLYVDPTNVQDMTNQLKKLVQDPILREKLREKAHIQVAKFTWEKNAKAAFNAFESSLKKVS